MVFSVYSAKKRVIQKLRRRLASPSVFGKVKPWFPKILGLGSRSHVFKGRLGRTNSAKTIFLARPSRLFAFNLRAKESGLLTTDHLDVLWRVVRRKVRRFGINFRRSSLAISLQLNATKTYTKRPKGGRMGSGKSPMHRRMVPVYNGQVILSCNEIRLFPFNTLLELKNAIKKLPVKCVVEVNKHSH